MGGSVLHGSTALAGLDPTHLHSTEVTEIGARTQHMPSNLTSLGTTENFRGSSEGGSPGLQLEGEWHPPGRCVGSIHSPQ